MADGIQSVMKGIDNVQHEMNQIVYRQNRASMYALREAGRIVKREAKKAAPTDSGTLKMSIRSLKRLKGNASSGWTNMVGPMPALGSASKKPGVRELAISNQIRTRFVKRYRRVEEERAHFMEAGYQAAAPQLRVIWERSVARANRGR